MNPAAMRAPQLIALSLATFVLAATIAPACAQASPHARTAASEPDLSLAGRWVNGNGIIYEFQATGAESFQGQIVNSQTPECPIDINAAAEHPGYYVGSAPLYDFLAPGCSRVSEAAVTIEVAPTGTTANFVSSAASCGNCGEQSWTREGAQPAATLTPSAASLTLTPVSGVVSVKQPGAASFTPLSGSIVVANGTDVNAIAGKLEVTVLTPGAATGETAVLYEGEFLIDEEANPPYETHFVLSQPLTGCGANAADTRASDARSFADARASGKRVSKRHLWAQDSGGTFGTTGRYVSTTVEGTKWLTSDECGRSSVTVTQGTVAVHNLISNTTVSVHAGQRYATSGHATGAKHTAAGGPLSALDAYWQAIRRGNFATAYHYLTPSAAGASEAQFVASESQEGIESASFRGRVSSRSASTATVRVVSLITHDRQFGCRTWHGSYRMTDRGKRWRIARAALTVKPCRP
jgi:hypothetical protein